MVVDCIIRLRTSLIDYKLSNSFAFKMIIKEDQRTFSELYELTRSPAKLSDCFLVNNAGSLASGGEISSRMLRRPSILNLMAKVFFGDSISVDVTRYHCKNIWLLKYSPKQETPHTLVICRY